MFKAYHFKSDNGFSIRGLSKRYVRFCARLLTSVSVNGLHFFVVNNGPFILITCRVEGNLSNLCVLAKFRDPPTRMSIVKDSGGHVERVRFDRIRIYFLTRGNNFHAHYFLTYFHVLQRCQLFLDGRYLVAHLYHFVNDFDLLGLLLQSKFFFRRAFGTVVVLL